MTAPRFLEDRARWPRLGMIRMGIMEGTGRSAHPREVSYFVLPDALREKYGEQPTRLPVMFPSDDVDRCLEVRYEKRGASGKLLIVCEGMGGSCRMFGEDGSLTDQPCRKVDREPCECGARARGHLNVILPEGGLGIYWLLLGGEGRLADIWNELRLYKATIGRLTNVVFEVVREPAEITVVTAKGRLVRTGWPAHVRVAMAAQQAFALHGVNVAALPGGQILQAALPPAAEEDDEAAPAETNGKVSTEAVTYPPSPANLAGQTDTPPADPRPDPPADLIDISVCIGEAEKCGVSADLYDRYLFAVYGTRSGDVTDATVAKEIAAFRRLKTEGERLAHKGELIRRLNEAMKVKRGSK